MDIMPYVVSSLAALVIGGFLGRVLPNPVTYLLIALASLFLILLVLIQRGRGGGLAGAFGGVGGSSAFGTRAGDVFTRVTIVTATAWIALNMGLVMRVNQRSAGVAQSAFAPDAPADDAAGDPFGDDLSDFPTGPGLDPVLDGGADPSGGLGGAPDPAPGDDAGSSEDR